MAAPRYIEKPAHVKEAVDRVVKRVKPVTEEEEVPVWEAVGLVLSRDVVAPYDFPPKPRSAYDGYAVRSADTPGRLRVLGEATIGRTDAKYVVTKGTAVYVSTGAYLPDGADTVVPEEAVRREGDYIIVDRHFPPHKNLDPVGFYVRRGQKLLPKGYVLSILDAVALLDIAVTRVWVYRPLRMALIVTGNELFELESSNRAEERILRGEVVESTGRLVEWLVSTYTPWVKIHKKLLLPDNSDVIAWFVEKQLENTDVIVMTGGSGPSSVDTFHQLAVKFGGEVLFRGLFVKGGKPTSALLLEDGRLLVVLSGHPMSAFHGFLRFLYPVLKYMGNVEKSVNPPLVVTARFAAEVEYARPQPVKVRLRFVDGELYAEPLPRERQLSSVTASNVEADAVALVGRGKYKKGDRVPVLVYREPENYDDFFGLEYG